MQIQTEKLSSQIPGASANTSSLRTQLLHSLATGVEYRHAFVEEKIRTGIAVQVKAIREQRQKNQAEFAKMLNKSQSWVSRLEDPNKAIPTIPTLLLLAKVFDVDLDVRFSPFSRMLHQLSRLTPEGFQVPSFDEECRAGVFSTSVPDSLVMKRGLNLASTTIINLAGSARQDIPSGAALQQRSA